jgi:hypothetical protein
MTGCFEIVENLCSMGVGQIGCSFDLHDDLLEANEVRLEDFGETALLVGEGQLRLFSEGDSLKVKLEAQAFLIA